MSGHVSYLAGLSAEQAVAAHYIRRGYDLSAVRWRGPAGEIDLIMRDAQTHVFVEVKTSRDFARAALRIGQRQQQRIMGSALAYVGRLATGLDTSMRFDVALVDGAGHIEIIENAFP